MPVDHSHSRLGRTAAHGSLGDPTVWDCPACGAQNTGRRPEQGCGSCGSGDPLQSQAGLPLVEQGTGGINPGGGIPSTYGRKLPSVGPAEETLHSRSPLVPTAPQRIYRLIEYAFNPGAQYDDMLRRSLVGRIEMPWGTLTATIVDTVDSQQEDRLKMARMQPGVWLAEPEAMHKAAHPLQTMSYEEGARRALEYFETEHQKRTRPLRQETVMPLETQVPNADEIRASARTFYLSFGARLTHTVAFALSSIASALTENSEPEKFLTGTECLQWAEALLLQVPLDWQGDAVGPVAPETLGVEGPPHSNPEEAQRIAAIKARLADAARPDPIYRENTKGLGGL